MLALKAGFDLAEAQCSNEARWCSYCNCSRVERRIKFVGRGGLMGGKVKRRDTLRLPVFRGSPGVKRRGGGPLSAL